MSSQLPIIKYITWLIPYYHTKSFRGILSLDTEKYTIVISAVFSKYEWLSLIEVIMLIVVYTLPSIKHFSHNCLSYLSIPINFKLTMSMCIGNLANNLHNQYFMYLIFAKYTEYIESNEKQMFKLHRYTSIFSFDYSDKTKKPWL